MVETGSRDHIDAGGEQRSNVRVLLLVRQRDARHVQHHVRLQSKNVIDPIGGAHARRRAPRDLAGIDTDLARVVDVDADQLQVRMVDHAA